MSANTPTQSGGGNETPTAAALAPGDRIITRSGLRVLSDITARTETFTAVSVKSGTLGFNRPAADMKIAPQQDVMVRDWRAEVLFDTDLAVVPVQQLCDGTYITNDAEAAPHLVYRLHFDQQAQDPVRRVFFMPGDPTRFTFEHKSDVLPNF